MKRLVVLLLWMLWGWGLPMQAQDGLNLPTELLILGNDGRLTLYGIGAQGVRDVTPQGAAFVVDFAVGPDGRTLAYRSTDGLYLTDLETPSAPRLIAAEAGAPALRGAGQSMAWSDEGDALLITTLDGAQVHWLRGGAPQDLALGPLEHVTWWGEYAALRGPGGLWWIHRRQGDSLNLISAIPQSNGMRWLSADRLLFAPPEGGLIEMDLANANAQTPRSAHGLYYILGTDSAHAMIFSGETPQTARLVEGGQAVEAVIDISAAWPMPDGAGLVSFRSGVLSLLNPRSGEGFSLPLPLASAYGWGRSYSPQGAAPPAAVTFIAAANGVRQVWLWGPSGAAETLTPSESDISDYALSADGRRIAYVSAGQLWEYALGTGDAPRALARLGDTISPAAPAYAPDGALYYRDKQQAGGQTLAGIWRALPDETPTLFIPDEPGRLFLRALPAPDVAALLIDARADDLPVLFNVRAEDNSLEVMAYGMTWARWLKGGQFIAAQGGSLYRFDVNQPAPQSLPPPLLTLREARLLDALPSGTAGQWRALLIEDVPALLPRVLLVEVEEEGGDPRLLSVPGYLGQAHFSADGLRVLGSEGLGRPLISDGQRAYGPPFWGASAIRWR